LILPMGAAIDLFIHPGEFEFADENFCIRTTLGSCVSIVLWHPQRKLGGMCHYMLPSRKRRAGRADSELSGKYADEALELMLREAEKLGTRPSDYEVKIFGGGNMFAGYRDKEQSVASRNVRSVKRLLHSRGLAVKSECLGGTGYRNIIFNIATGDVWVRRVEIALAKNSARANE
jgi:chemotaxis protein CheD